MKNHAFTLVELLVVISVISLLSSVIFSSVGEAREKAQDAAVAVQMRSLMTQVELSAGGSVGGGGGGEAITDFSTVCSREPGSEGIFDSILDLIEEEAAGEVGCLDNEDEWAVAAQLNNSVLCIDSTGYIGTTQKGKTVPYWTVFGIGASALGRQWDDLPFCRTNDTISPP